MKKNNFFVFLKLVFRVIYFARSLLKLLNDLISTKLKIILIKTTILLIFDMFRIYIIHHQNKYIISIQSLNTSY